MNLNSFFDQLWKSYIQLAPRAREIHQIILKRNSRIVNDHIAFRTFNRAPISLEDLEGRLLELGYRPLADYEFKLKKLRARAYIHETPDLPLIFLSELLTEQLSAQSRGMIEEFCLQIDPAQVRDFSVFWAGRLWNPPTWSDYRALLQESEYAAWLAMIGMNPNHFTIRVNDLDNTGKLEEVLALVEAGGFELNTSGGKIKGSPEELLEQSSTLADRGEFTFADGVKKEIPTCYYEFARRYPDEKGELYMGFIAASADKIFESTDS